MERNLQQLNLGCGQRFLPHWTNLDFVGQEPSVRSHDLRKPLPFQDGRFAIVYHSHVLEHLTQHDARRLLRECHRVLAPGGVLRVVVPDLEQKARLYLSKLESVIQNAGETQRAEHEWMVIETLDQIARTKPGGSMIDFMRSGRAEAFVRARIGDEWERSRGADSQPQPSRPKFAARIRMKLRSKLRAFALRVLGLDDADYDYLRFRRTGELHLWMYDRASLGEMLADTGFTECRTEGAATSRIPNWTENGASLDMEENTLRKPDSLYMEAVKR